MSKLKGLLKATSAVVFSMAGRRVPVHRESKPHPPFMTSDHSPLNTILAAGVLLLLALVAPLRAEPGNDNRAPDLSDCPELKVDAGNKVAFHAYADGVQIYRWNGTSWVFVAPEGVLFADAEGHGVVGIHYRGPTWEANDGSTVVGTVLKPFPVPDAIPWLKLAAVPNEAPGIFHRVNFIQRVNTVGGKAPTDAGDFVGQEARVPYTAEYFFYRKQQ